MAPVAPRALARFNRIATNKLVRPMARNTRALANVIHVGRKSGKEYSTPITPFVHGDQFAVILTYGTEADWVQNVLAGQASLQHRGRIRRMTDVRIVPEHEVSHLPRRARVVGRAAGNVLVATLAD
jgi:deazaflavin-dependent oxidoreductase (nitroreductase family)